MQALRDRAWRADLHNACLWLHIIASLIETEAISRLAVRVAHDDPGGIHRPVKVCGLVRARATNRSFSPSHHERYSPTTRTWTRLQQSHNGIMSADMTAEC